MMPTDLTKPNAKQILRHHTDAISTVFVERRKYTSSTTTVLHFCMMPTDLLGIWLRQILRHHTDAISTVFVERILVQQQLKIPYFQKKNTFYLKLLTALKQFTKTAFCLGGNKVTHCRSIFKKKTYFIKIPNFQKTLYLKQFRFSETLFFSKYHIPATTRLLCCIHCSINHAENFCNIIFKIAVLLGN